MIKMKISFDFDGTLTKPKIQELAKLYMAKGNDVHITTARNEDPKDNAGYPDPEHKMLYKIALECGIHPEKVHFTNLQPKYNFLEGFDIHYDDQAIEIELMEENGIQCIGFLV